MTETCAAIIDLLGCDHELLHAAAGGRAIYRRYKMLARQGETAGFLPLVVYASDALLEALHDNLALAEAENCAEYHAKLLPLVERIDALALLQQRLSFGIQGRDPVELMGNFMEQPAPQNEDRLCQSCRNHAREVLIFKCPVQQPWELPLFVPMGGFGGCPAPAEQAAVARLWHTAYGAVPVVIACDILEFRVAHPPVQLLETERLAMQQFAFNFDLISQRNSLLALASELVGAKAWYFWWHT